MLILRRSRVKHTRARARAKQKSPRHAAVVRFPEVTGSSAGAETSRNHPCVHKRKDGDSLTVCGFLDNNS